MLHFAAAGSPRTTANPGGSVKGLQRCSELGITAMELEWVQQVPKNPERLEEVRVAAEELDISLTVHAPYFVNLNAQDPEKLEASKKRVVDCMNAAQAVGAHSVCVHPAFYLKMDPDEVYTNVATATEDILERTRDISDVNLAYETMGKPTQFGTLEEVLRLSKEFGLYPTVDTAHMHARSNGEWNTEEEFHAIFDMYEKYLGATSLKHMHMHYSGIEYTEKGERKHLPFKESDANYEQFLTVLRQRGIEGNLVCESPIQEDDTILLRDMYAKMG